MIEIGNENKKIKNKDKWNYCNHMHILTFLGDNNRLPLLHMDICLICLKEKKERMNDYDIGYMIHPSLHVNKSFRY